MVTEDSDTVSGIPQTGGTSPIPSAHPKEFGHSSPKAPVWKWGRVSKEPPARRPSTERGVFAGPAVVLPGGPGQPRESPGGWGVAGQGAPPSLTGGQGNAQGSGPRKVGSGESVAEDRGGTRGIKHPRLQAGLGASLGGAGTGAWGMWGWGLLQDGHCPPQPCSRKHAQRSRPSGLQVGGVSPGWRQEEVVGSQTGMAVREGRAGPGPDGSC